jgi:hypothetical protein
MFAWSQLDFSAIPVAIPAVSLTNRQNLQNVKSKRRLQRIKMYIKEKTSEKRHLAAFVFVPSVFGETFSAAEF